MSTFVVPPVCYRHNVAVLFAFFLAACKIEWETAIHDGPVKVMSRSPHLPKLILTMGGYSWAVWKEGGKVRILRLDDRFFLVVVHQYSESTWVLNSLIHLIHLRILKVKGIKYLHLDVLKSVSALEIMGKNCDLGKHYCLFYSNFKL